MNNRRFASATGTDPRSVLWSAALLAALAATGAPAIAADEPVLAPFKQLTLAGARRAADAALADCRQRGYQVSVAIVDRAGLLQVFMRDRFAGPHTIEVARSKAWTAVSFKISTTELATATSAPSAENGIRMVPGVMVNGGGLPITAAGSLVGAIGVSGAPGGAADQQCAQAGIDAIADDLEF